MTIIRTISDGAPFDVDDRDLSGWCTHGKHGRCAHNPGGAHHGGVPFEALGTIPAYTWHCGCPCHTDPLHTDGQGVLF